MLVGPPRPDGRFAVRNGLLPVPAEVLGVSRPRSAGQAFRPGHYRDRRGGIPTSTILTISQIQNFEFDEHRYPPRQSDINRQVYEVSRSRWGTGAGERHTTNVSL